MLVLMRDRHLERSNKPSSLVMMMLRDLREGKPIKEFLRCHCLQLHRACEAQDAGSALTWTEALLSCEGVPVLEVVCETRRVEAVPLGCALHISLVSQLAPCVAQPEEPGYAPAIGSKAPSSSTGFLKHFSSKSLARGSVDLLMPSPPVHQLCFSRLARRF